MLTLAGHQTGQPAKAPDEALGAWMGGTYRRPHANRIFLNTSKN